MTSISIKKTNLLMLFREVITIYCENNTRPYVNSLFSVGKGQSYFDIKSRLYIEYA
jgi:hypothetical protein